MRHIVFRDSWIVFSFKFPKFKIFVDFYRFIEIDVSLLYDWFYEKLYRGSFLTIFFFFCFRNILEAKIDNYKNYSKFWFLRSIYSKIIVIERWLNYYNLFSQINKDFSAFFICVKENLINSSNSGILKIFNFDEFCKI